MSPDPPLPIIPTGESRAFDLVLPELPSIGGPGTGPNPSGSGGSSACQDELGDLIDALTADPSSANSGALVEFIEMQTGQSMSDLVPEWDQVAADGESREGTVEVCASIVDLTITGDFIGSATCESLPTKLMPFEDASLSAPATIDGTNPPAPDPPTSGNSTYDTTDFTSDASFNLQSARMMWLRTTTGSEDLAILERHEALSGGTVMVSGVEWAPVVRIQASYTSSLTSQSAHAWNFFTLAWEVDTNIYLPSVMLGFKKLERWSDPIGDPPYADDPVSVGTYTPGSPNTVDASDYNDAPDQIPFYYDSAERWFPIVSYDETMNLAFEGSSIAEVQDRVDEWNANKSIYDPDVTLTVPSGDPSLAYITVEHLSKQNALYFAAYGCHTDESSQEYYTAITAVCGGYIYSMGSSFPRAKVTSADAGYLMALLIRLARDSDDTCDLTRTAFDRLLPQEGGTYAPQLSAATADISPDGQPPATTPNPPIVPVGGGCRSFLDGPSSCQWTVPPGDVPMPGDNFGGAPVFHANFPDFPFDCHIPDFGNMNPCGPGGAGGGTGGPLPGGRDRRGRRGDHRHVKTGGKSYGNPRRKTFSEKRCPGEDMPGVGWMTVVTLLLMDCGISPLDIIFQVTAEWDKPFPQHKCFRKGSRIWDAAEWTARYGMCKIVDEGEPTNNIYIGPPWHRPGQTTWHFNEHIDLFVIDRGFSSEEIYGAVEVFGPNVTEPVIALVDSPFVTDDSPTLLVEVGANHSLADAQDLAAYKASLVRRDGTSIQVDVPYSSEYFLRDKFVVQAPDKGIEETYIITGKESAVSAEQRDHILTGMLPATLRELDEFPTPVDSVDDELPGTVFLPS